MLDDMDARKAFDEVAGKLVDLIILEANNDQISKLLDDILAEQRLAQEDMSDGNYFRAALRLQLVGNTQLALIWTVLKEQRDLWARERFGRGDDATPDN